MQKKTKKVLSVVVLTISIIMNVYWIVTCYYYKVDAVDDRIYLDQKSPDCQELFSKENYQKIFIEKNDSTYQRYFNRFFVNTPGQSYLLACAFYLLKNDTKSLEDLRSAIREMEGMYGKAPDMEILKR